MSRPSAAPSSGSQVGRAAAGGVAGAGLGGGPQEQRGLQALAADREDRDQRRATSGRRPRPRSIWPRSSPPMPRAAAAIQKIIQVTKPTATIESAAADRLLGLEGQAAGAEGEQRRRRRG